MRVVTSALLVTLLATLVACSGAGTQKGDAAGFVAASVVESIAKMDQPAVSRAFGRTVSASEMNRLASIVPPDLADPDTPDVRLTHGDSWKDATGATASVWSVDENSTLTIEVDLVWDEARSDWTVSNVRRKQ